jgi:hypothetical protein
MHQAYLRSGQAQIVFRARDVRSGQISIRLVPPAQLERATGTFRSPEFLVDVPPACVTAITESEHVTLIGEVVGLLVHTVSGRAAAIGPFPTSSAANDWWYQPFNRLAGNADVLFLLVQTMGDARA